MDRRALGVLAVVLGILAVLLALLADTVGIGAKEQTFGWKQVLLLLVGVALAIGGLVAVFRPPGEGRGPAPGPPSET